MVGDPFWFIKPVNPLVERGFATECLFFCAEILVSKDALRMSKYRIKRNGVYHFCVRISIDVHLNLES